MSPIINDDLKNSVSLLQQEVKKDIYFFGACGFVVGIMFIWQIRFKELGIFDNPKFASIIFSDFLAGYTFSFILALYMLSGLIVNFLGCNNVKLQTVRSHIGNRFYQVGSVIISFLVGFSSFTFIYFLIRLELNGIFLAIIAFLLASFLAETIFIADLLVLRKKPFDKSLIFTVFFWIVTFFLIRLMAT
jgi:hypothetical protein